MGWGTFIAGQVAGNARRAGRNRSGSSDALKKDFDNILKRKVIFENEVLKEIKRLNAEGKEVDVNAVRVDMRRIRRAYEKMGPSLELRVIRESQKRALAGKSVNRDEIEMEIINEYRPFPWGQVLLWVFVPYVPLTIHLRKKYQSEK